MNKTGLALSIQQPWAWLIVNGHKSIENRDWQTSVRGVIGIHAGKQFDAEGFEWITEMFPLIDLPAIVEFQRGGIVGRARLIDCVQYHESEWFFGKYGFVFTDAEPLPFQACRGQLGFFRPQLTLHPQQGDDR